MKHFEPTEKRTTIAVYVFLVSLFAVFCVIIGINIKRLPALVTYVMNVLKPLLYGFAIAFVISPLVKLGETRIFRSWKPKKEGIKRIVCVALAYLLVVLMIFLFVLAILPELTSSYKAISGQFGDFDDKIKVATSNVVSMLPGREGVYVYSDTDPDLRKDVTDSVLVQSLDSLVPVKIKVGKGVVHEIVGELADKVFESFENFVGSSIPAIFSSVLAIINWAKNLIVGIMVSVYILLREKQIIAKISSVFRVWLPRPVYRYSLWVIEKAKNIFRDYIIVRIFDGFIVGILMYVCLSLFRTPYAMFLSVIMGTASFFPFIGPVIGILLGTLITMIADMKYLLVYIIIAVVLNLLDSRYVEPFLNSGRRNHKLSSVWVFIAIVFMGGLYGIGGVVFGIPMFAFFYSIIKETGERRLKRKGMSEYTTDYFVLKRAPVLAADGSEAENITDYISGKREGEEEELRRMKEAAKHIAGKVKHVLGKKKTDDASPDEESHTEDSHEEDSHDDGIDSAEERTTDFVDNDSAGNDSTGGGDER